MSQTLAARWNGAALTWGSSATLPASGNTEVGDTVEHQIGCRYNGSSYVYPFDGYLAETHLIVGSNPDYTEFGQTVGGVWVPKAYTGAHGANGGYWPYSDNATTAALGTDNSSSGNDLTVTNFGVTAGTGNDSLTDTPTDYDDGGNGVGNYPTLDPLKNNVLAAVTISNGNLDYALPANPACLLATFGIPPNSGKIYFEVTITYANIRHVVGMVDISIKPTQAPGNTSSDDSVGIATAPWVRFKSTAASGTAPSIIGGDVVMIAYDSDTGKWWCGVNGTWMNGGNPGAGTGEQFTLTSGVTYAPAVGNSSNSASQTGSLNFGQSPFAYTAPSGFKALCTQNLTDTTVITSGSFTGNASADGPVVWLNGVPETLEINGNAVTWGTHALKLASGFKVITSSSSYNAAGSNTFSVTASGAAFRNARAQAN